MAINLTDIISIISQSSMLAQCCPCPVYCQTSHVKPRFVKTLYFHWDTSSEQTRVQDPTTFARGQKVIVFYSKSSVGRIPLNKRINHNWLFHVEGIAIGSKIFQKMCLLLRSELQSKKSWRLWEGQISPGRLGGWQLLSLPDSQLGFIMRFGCLKCWASKEFLIILGFKLLLNPSASAWTVGLIWF